MSTSVSYAGRQTFGRPAAVSERRRSDLRLDSRIRAALFYDVPELRGLGVPGRAFVDAFGPPPLHLEDSGDPDDALVMAARGTISGRSGMADQAMTLLTRLGQKGASERLLASMVVVWLESLGPTDGRLDDIAEQIELVGDPATRSRLWMKLATICHVSANARFPEFLARAQANAPRGTLLSRAISGVAISNGIAAELSDDPAMPDELVSASWIDSQALDAARQQLFDAVDAEALGIWGWRIRWGRTPLDAAAGAYLQATWAGLLWHVPSYARQYAAQALLAGPVSSDQAAEIGTLWVGEGGKNIAGVLQRLERHLSSEGADTIARRALRGWVAPATRPFRLADMIRGLWDTVSDEMALELLDQVTPLPAAHAVAGTINSAYALLGIRRPAEFLTAFETHDDPTKMGVLAYLSKDAVDTLPPAVCHGLLDSSPPLDGAPTSAYVAVAALAANTRLAPPFDLVEATDVVIDSLAEEFPALLDQNRLEAAVRRAGEAVLEEAAQAHTGTFGFGGPSPRARLAWIAVNAPEAAGQTVRILRIIAGDHDLPIQHRFEAVVGLGHLANAGLVDKTELLDLDLEPESDRTSRLPKVGGATPEDLEAAAVAARAKWWTIDDVAQAMIMSRSPSDSVRQTIISALGGSLAGPLSTHVEPILLGALFDPIDEIVRTALIQIGDRRLQSPGAESLLKQRIVILYREGRNLLRGAAVHVARSRVSDSPASDESDLVRLARAAVRDPSWRVRREATR